MLTKLPWLPPAPEDYRQKRLALKAAVANGGDGATAWQTLKWLAGHALDEAQLVHVATLSDELGHMKNTPPAYSFALAGDGTLSLLNAPIAGSAVRHDLRLTAIETEYGKAVQDALDPESDLRRAKPDFLIVACDRRGLGLDRLRASAEEAHRWVDSAFATIRAIADGLRPSVKRAVLVQTIVPPADALFGSFDVASISSPYAQALALNAKLVAWAAESGVVLLDVARLASSIGLERWDDPQQWHASKLPFSFDAVPLYADFVARTLAALAGKARKCLVLDLDNTLWGGVIGDDGVGGIVLGQGTARGEAFLAIQRMALDLRDRGVILAVCSKNEPDAARIPFREHSEMVLKEEHIATFQANWVDKAANLRAIAQALNIGLDALVFLDDNPAERAQVRQELPMVAVPELPASPALYPATLLAAGYFDATSFGDEDRTRAENYRADAGRALLEAGASNMSEYLTSLNMVCTIRPFDKEGRARTAQLINKSNQFNLTTRRYTEQEVAALEADGGTHTMQVQLVDRFGNNGMISVVIARKAPKVWTIDTWLMSCRVLGRRVEEAVLVSLAAAARKAGAKTLAGHYIPSAKNRMVADHYGKLGFRKVAENADGAVWELALADHVAPVLPMQIEELSAAAL
jgi:FkbH-like protein